MSHDPKPSSNEPSHTTEAIVHGDAHGGHADPLKSYLTIWAILMGLLVVTVAAASISIPEPFSFIVALTIAVVKAVLVVLFFMHVKDASRVTWVFCGGSVVWLAIMFALTFNDYLTRHHANDSTSEPTSVAAPSTATPNPS